MTRPTIIAGNWKMHKTIGEAKSFVEALIPKAKEATCKIFIAPPFTAITASAAAASGSNIVIGAQNMSDADEGAFTGEISARMLRDAGAQFVILGHSERRIHFHEVDEHIHHKLRRAIQEEIPAILCIGEHQEDRDQGRSEAVLKQQLNGSLGKCTQEDFAHIMVAYEPVWAIGTGKTATPEIAQETHHVIRAHIAQKWGGECAQDLPILYGGSVKPANIDSLLNQPDIDGALIGGASLDVEAFGTMVQR